MPRATMTSRGQTVIPKSVREHLGLHPGDEVDFIIQEDGEVLVKPATEDVHHLRGFLRVEGRATVSLKEMRGAIRRRGGRG